MAELRIRLTVQDFLDLLKVQFPNTLIEEGVFVEVWDASDNQEIPLITMEDGDHIDIVFR